MQLSKACRCECGNACARPRGPEARHSRRRQHLGPRFGRHEAAFDFGQLALALCLSVKTVSTYRTRVMEKMMLASNSDLTYYAMKNGLIH